MKDKPTGLVTFLFTDIEGSTLLAQDFPESLPTALEKHHAILHKATESNNGFVYEIVGDAFCCAFHNSVDAINAAIAAQINLANEKWDEVKINIRIGIHSGNVEWNGKRYMGYITLARTARVMSAAYGEQIIISNDAYELAIEKTPNKITFRDLGERRLKDLKQPVRLYQILSEGLREDFPPLKTLDARPNNLPVQLTSFIGREHEMKVVKDLLKQTHLLTLTGSGGAGKTRLALQVAADVIDDFANGVWFVELASLSEPAFLPQAIMKVFDIKEEPKRSLEDTLCDYLRDKEILIILDNCEHLVEECAKLTEKLLISCPKLKIIATSREGLRCEGEQTHRVLSLEVPDPKGEDSPEALSQFEAVRLFIERALSVDDSFRINNNNAPALAEICYQLDGIPLAIELAAARTKVLSIEQIYERLNDRFNLLTGGKRTALPRQQTLRALIDWSYDLLSVKEQIMWARLSVFSGGWTLEAAEEVCSDEKIKKEEVLELLNQLTEKSIINFERENERYRILETIKQYGAEKLREENGSEVVLFKHLQHFMEFAEIAAPKLTENVANVWLEKLEADSSNFQLAAEWSLNGIDTEKGARLCGALGAFWDIRGHYSLGRRLYEIILNNTFGISKSVLGIVLNSAGYITTRQGEYKQATKLFEMSILISSELNDKRGLRNSLSGLSTLFFYMGEYGQSLEYSDKSFSLSSELGDKQGTANSLNNLGMISDILGKYEEAQKYFEESLKLRRELGDKNGIASSLNNLADIALNRGNFNEANEFFEKCLELFRELGYTQGIANSLVCLGDVALYRGKYYLAKQYFEESLDLFSQIGLKRGIAVSKYSLGNVSYSIGNYKGAQNSFEESLLIFENLGEKSGIAFCINSLGNIEYSKRNYEQAEKFFVKDLELRRNLGDNRVIAHSLCCLGNLEYIRGNFEQSFEFFLESLNLGIEIEDKYQISFSLIGLSGIFCRAHKISSSVILLGSVDAFLVSMDIVLEKHEQQLQEQITNILHEKLSDDEFSKYFEEGKKLSLKQAAELALSNV